MDHAIQHIHLTLHIWNYPSDSWAALKNELVKLVLMKGNRSTASETESSQARYKAYWSQLKVSWLQCILDEGLCHHSVYGILRCCANFSQWLTTVELDWCMWDLCLERAVTEQKRSENTVHIMRKRQTIKCRANIHLQLKMYGFIEFPCADTTQPSNSLHFIHNTTQ